MTHPDERPTPEADAARVPALEVSAWVEVVNVDLARGLERERDEARAKLDATCSPESFNALVRQRTELIAERDALRAALRELDEATSAAYPAFEVGADAQLAWSDRIDNARRSARSLLGEAT